MGSFRVKAAGFVGWNEFEEHLKVRVLLVRSVRFRERVLSLVRRHLLRHDRFEIYREVMRQVGEQDRDVGDLGHDCGTTLFYYLGYLLVIRPNEVFEKLRGLYREAGSKITRCVELLPVPHASELQQCVD